MHYKSIALVSFFLIFVFLAWPVDDSDKSINIHDTVSATDSTNFVEQVVNLVHVTVQDIILLTETNPIPILIPVFVLPFLKIKRKHKNNGLENYCKLGGGGNA